MYIYIYISIYLYIFICMYVYIYMISPCKQPHPLRHQPCVISPPGQVTHDVAKGYQVLVQRPGALDRILGGLVRGCIPMAT